MREYIPAAVPTTLLAVIMTTSEASWVFFNEKIFWLMLVILASDFVSGVMRVLLDGTFSWRKFPRVFIKLIVYVVIYAQLHAIALMSPLASHIDEIGMLLLTVKETISSLQNLQALTGNAGLALLMNLLNLILEKIPGGTTLLPKPIPEYTQDETLK